MTCRKYERTARVVVAFVTAAFAISATAEAQRPGSRRAAPPKADTHEMNDARTTGLSLGVHTIAATGISISAAEFDGAFETKLGPGAGVTAGYGFNRTFSAFVSFDVAKQRTSADVEPAGTFGLVHFVVGGRANLPLGSATTVPYLSASVGRRAVGARVTIEEIGESFDMSFSGTMLGLGGGIQRFISPTLALDGGVDLGFGKLDNAEAGENKTTIAANGSTSVRFRIGMTWRPGGRRST
jgi:hypothetical protein